MLNYPVEKVCLRFYKFTFWGLEDEPVTVEAFNKVKAKIILRDYILSNPKYHNKDIINMTIAIPIVGETTKIVDEVELVYIHNKWIPLFEFKQKMKDYEKE